MITLMLEDFPKAHEKWWEEYCDMGFGTNSHGHNGYRSYIENNNPEIRTAGNIKVGIKLMFYNDSDATMFALRWS